MRSRDFITLLGSRNEGIEWYTLCCTCSGLLLALSVISLLRSDSVAFGCEADIRTVERSNQSDVNVESRGGISPPRAPRTVREPLDSYGSRCSAVAMT